MRKVAVVTLLVLWWAWCASAQTATPVSGAAQASTYTGTQGPSNTLNFNGTSIPNGALIVWVQALADNKSVTQGTPTDSKSNTYTACGSNVDNTTSHIEEQMFYATNTGTSGTITVTQNVSASFTGFAGQFAMAFTYSGGVGASPCDGSAQGMGSSTTWTTSPNFTTTKADTLLVGQCLSNGTDTPYGNGGGPTTTTNLSIGEPYVDGYANLTSTTTAAFYSTGVGAAAQYVCVAADFVAATQPAASKMMPFVAQIISRFWPSYLHLFPEGNPR